MVRNLVEIFARRVPRGFVLFLMRRGRIYCRMAFFNHRTEKFEPLLLFLFLVHSFVRNIKY